MRLLPSLLLLLLLCVWEGADANVNAVDKGGSGCTPSAKCAEGEGDCDTNADCEAGLECFQREHGEAVPGMNAIPSTIAATHDFCFVPPTPVQFNGNSGCSTSSKCAAGEGDCDDDDECQAGLTCLQRSNGEPVPEFGLKGLTDSQMRLTDFCYDKVAAVEKCKERCVAMVPSGATNRQAVVDDLGVGSWYPAPHGQMFSHTPCNEACASPGTMGSTYHNGKRGSITVDGQNFADQWMDTRSNAMVIHFGQPVSKGITSVGKFDFHVTGTIIKAYQCARSLKVDVNSDLQWEYKCHSSKKCAMNSICLVKFKPADASTWDKKDECWTVGMEATSQGGECHDHTRARFHPCWVSTPPRNHRRRSPTFNRNYYDNSVSYWLPEFCIGL